MMGAVLLFDFNNIRYVTSTHIGEWARDKMTRYSLLTRGGDPHIWDFGSAAKHHRLNCPWLPQDNIHAGMVGMRGAIAADAGLFRSAAREIKAILQAEGVADMPIGMDIAEPPMLAALVHQMLAIFFRCTHSRQFPLKLVQHLRRAFDTESCRHFVSHLPIPT